MISPKYNIGDVVLIQPNGRFREALEYDTEMIIPKYREGIICSVEWKNESRDWQYGVKVNSLGKEKYLSRFAEDILGKVN